MTEHTPEYCSFIDGKWCAGKGDVLEIRNPANLDETVATARLADCAQANEAMKSVDRAFSAWSRTPVAERLEILRLAVDRLEANTDSVGRLITQENGKTLPESRAEVEASIRDARYQLKAVEDTIWHQPRAGTGSAEIECAVHREPCGVYLLITPWNFPLATIVRKVVPALGFGNAVVMKPAQLTPGAAVIWLRALIDAGLPAGVANLVLGRGDEVGSTLIDSEALRGVSFTGSTEIGLDICRQTAERQVRLQMEMGGKNAIVVLSDADLDIAVDSTVLAAYSCAGQWCTSTSRAIVERSVYSEFLARLKTKVETLSIGDGTFADTAMGPVISDGQRLGCVDAIAVARAAGAQILTGGEALDEIDGRRGYFMQPTVLRDVTPDMQLAREEVFGPVLAVIPADGPGDALRIANATCYGLTFSIYTRSAEWAEKFIAEVDAGMCHLNLPTAYRDASLPVGGWKESGRGVPECGDEQKHFYTRLKAVYRAAAM